MTAPKTHVYFMPGLAAGKEIFKNIALPEDRYDITILEWQIPGKKETLEAYAKRMAEFITQDDAVLVGVSFGGVLVQEMKAFLNLRKLIIVSSVKSKHELPPRLKFARKTSAYRLVPTGLVLSTPDLTKFAIGPRTRKRLGLYQEYLSVRSKVYLDWAIRNMVCWDREEVDEKVVHIHGDKDPIFPVKNIDDYLPVEGGTHVMIINKGKRISQMLLEVIEK